LSDFQDSPVILLGGGGHAKVVLEALVLSGRNILGVVTPDCKEGDHFCGFPVLGNDEYLDDLTADEVVLANGIGAMVYQHTRRSLAESMRKKGFTFCRIIHPSAIIASDVEIAKGAQVMAGSIIQPGTYVGVDSVINTGVLVDHDCRIEDNCHLAPGVICCGGVHVHSKTFIGAGTTIMQNLSIAKNSIIGAGSLVCKDFKGTDPLIQKRS